MRPWICWWRISPESAWNGSYYIQNSWPPIIFSPTWTMGPGIWPAPFDSEWHPMAMPSGLLPVLPSISVRPEHTAIPGADCCCPHSRMWGRCEMCPHDSLRSPHNRPNRWFRYTDSWCPSIFCQFSSTRWGSRNGNDRNRTYLAMENQKKTLRQIIFDWTNRQNPYLQRDNCTKWPRCGPTVTVPAPNAEPYRVSGDTNDFRHWRRHW